MKNRIYTLGIIAFTIMLMLTSIDILAFRKPFFYKQYSKLNTAETMGMSSEDLHKSTEVLLDYIKGKQETIDLEVTVHGQVVEMFNQREKDHMVDVKNLYGVMKTVQISLAVFVAIVTLVALGLFDFFNFRQSQKNTTNSLLIMGGIMSGLALYAFIDFNSFWTSFHEVFFSNDLWLLDPTTDRMIQMFPEPFFNAMVTRIIIAIGTILVLKAILIFVFKCLADLVDKRSEVI